MHWLPPDDELLLDEELLEEELLDEELLDELLEDDELEEEPPYTEAVCDVAAIPSWPLIRRLPQVVKLAGLKLLTISNEVQHEPLPDQDQPM